MSNNVSESEKEIPTGYISFIHSGLMYVFAFGFVGSILFYLCNLLITAYNSIPPNIHNNT